MDNLDQIARELMHRLERYPIFDIEKPLAEIPAEIRTDIHCVALALREAARDGASHVVSRFEKDHYIRHDHKYDGVTVYGRLKAYAKEIEPGEGQ